MFELAFQLGVSIRHVMEEMSYTEVLGWFAYFEQRPIGWRGYDQAASVIQAQGCKEKPWKIFPILETIYNPPKPGGFDIKGFKGSLLFQKIQNAKGGEKLDYDKL